MVAFALVAFALVAFASPALEVRLPLPQLWPMRNLALPALALPAQALPVLPVLPALLVLVPVLPALPALLALARLTGQRHHSLKVVDNRGFHRPLGRSFH